MVKNELTSPARDKNMFALIVSVLSLDKSIKEIKDFVVGVLVVFDLAM